MQDSIEKIIDIVKQTLEKTPPELASDIMENELVMSTDVYKNGNLIYLAHPAVWYTAEGGITALDLMLQDLESELIN